MAKTGDLTSTELETLIWIARHTNLDTDGIPPRTRKLARQLSKVDSAISNIKAALRSKNYIDEAGLLTDKARRLLEQVRTVIPARFPIVGKVQAGSRKHDELEAVIENIQQLQDLDINTVTIPDIQDPENVVALSVVGDSMVEERIYEGDLLLVQLFNNHQGPKEGELIITQYLANKDEPFVIAEGFSASDGIPNEFLEGPTVKYFYSRADHFRLSTRKGFDENPHTIRTKYIKPIGRVIGVYRPIE